MFARKRKPRDEEPLVPHGMIWQATEESMPPSKADPPQPGPLGSKADEMPKFWRNSAPPDPSVRRAPVSVRPPAQSVKDTPKKIETKAAPLPWPHAPVQELTKRRMLIQEERAQEKPAIPKPISVTRPASVVARPDETPSSNVAIPPKPVLVPIPPHHESTPPTQGKPTATQKNETKLRAVATRPKELELRKQIGKILAWFGEIQRGIATTLAELARACRSATARGFSELSRHAKSIYDARRLAGKISFTTQPRKSIAAPEDNSGTDLPAQISSGKHPPQIKSATTLLLIETRRGIAAFSSFARNLSSRRVKIRIAADTSPLRIVRNLSEIRVLAAEAFRKNSRPVTALAMAAVSAVLALGLIVAVKRYEPANGATVSKQAPAAPETVTAPAFTISRSPVKPATVIETRTSVRKTSKIPAGEATGNETPAIRAAASRKQLRRGPHHSDDDDYVAKDTYTYYGKR